jgi:hypothetical protein
MRHKGFHYSTYLTRISFDPLKAHPEHGFPPGTPARRETRARLWSETDRKTPRLGRIIGHRGKPAPASGN